MRTRGLVILSRDLFNEHSSKLGCQHVFLGGRRSGIIIEELVEGVGVLDNFQSWSRGMRSELHLKVGPEESAERLLDQVLDGGVSLELVVLTRVTLHSHPG